MAAHPHGFRFDQHRTVARAGAGDRFARGALDRDNVIPVHDGALDAVSLGAIREIRERNLALDRRRIRPLIIFHDQHERGFLHRRQVQSFVETRRSTVAAIADPGHRHDVLAQVTSRHGDARHHRNQVAQHGGWRNDVPHFQVSEMAGAVFALRGRGCLAPLMCCKDQE